MSIGLELKSNSSSFSEENLFLYSEIKLDKKVNDCFLHSLWPEGIAAPVRKEDEK